MMAFTTRQRDLLKLLLDAKAPLGVADLAAQLGLTPRQVSYDLRSLRHWLACKSVVLEMTPGVGVELRGSDEQRQSLTELLVAKTRFQLVLTASQRRQLFALILVVADEPLILYQLQRMSGVARTTVIKDIDAIAAWILPRGFSVERRPNFGVWIQGTEWKRREALTALLWGQSGLGEPLTTLTHTDGLTFALASDRELLPLVGQVYGLIRQWNVKRAFSVIAYAEAQLGGRFTDDAVLYLALAFAIQAQRVQEGHLVEVDAQTLSWLQSLKVWPVSVQIAKRLGWYWPAKWPESEIARLAMCLLAAPRNERWPGDLETDNGFTDLVDELMQDIESAYQLPGLRQDRTLRDGIVNHVVPACLCQRFDVWMPPSPDMALSEKYAFEYATARNLVGLIEKRMGVELPESETNNLAMLLRAAYIRRRPNRVREVVVVCPSGMATAQLLVARLKAHFPHLGQFRVVSLRELGKKRSSDPQIVITTVPLPETISVRAQVIQVHPLLLPEDIERITQLLA